MTREIIYFDIVVTRENLETGGTFLRKSILSRKEKPSNKAGTKEEKAR